MGAAVDLCKQRLEELVVRLSIHGDALAEVTPAEMLQAAQAVCGGDTEAADAAAAAHAGCSCSGVLCMTAESSSAGSSSAPCASLSFTMPPGYPVRAALQCHVTSADLPRATVDALSLQLQQQATATQGFECLHELAATLQVELNQLQHQQQEAVQQQQVQQRLQQQQEPGSEYRMVLLRLDHMRDRVGYTATIKQWTAELHLTGWLLFWQQLILILLEGIHTNISTYLRRARTVCVDVDSNGRKCRERMLAILEDSATAGSASTGIADGTTSTTQATQGLQQRRSYQDFRVLTMGSLDDVVQQLFATHPRLDAQALRKLLGLA